MTQREQELESSITLSHVSAVKTQISSIGCFSQNSNNSFREKVVVVNGHQLSYDAC